MKLKAAKRAKTTDEYYWKEQSYNEIHVHNILIGSHSLFMKWHLIRAIICDFMKGQNIKIIGTKLYWIFLNMCLASGHLRVRNIRTLMNKSYNSVQLIKKMWKEIIPVKFFRQEVERFAC